MGDDLDDHVRPIARTLVRTESSPRSVKSWRLGFVLAMTFVSLALAVPPASAGGLVWDPLGGAKSECAPACDHAEGLFRQQKMQSIPACGHAEGLFSRVFKHSHGPRTVGAVRCRLRFN